MGWAGGDILLLIRRGSDEAFVGCIMLFTVYGKRGLERGVLELEDRTASLRLSKPIMIVDES
jgi:hypothetical protein